MKKFGSLFLVSLLSGVMTLGAYKLIFDNNGSPNNIVSVAPNNYSRTVGLGAETVDFTTAADKAVHSVVHVKNVSRRTVNNPIMEFFYGYGGQQQQVDSESKQPAGSRERTLGLRSRFARDRIPVW